VSILNMSQHGCSVKCSQLDSRRQEGGLSLDMSWHSGVVQRSRSVSKKRERRGQASVLKSHGREEEGEDDGIPGRSLVLHQLL
jgi:hypothetical protein